MTNLQRIEREARLGRHNLRRARAALTAEDQFDKAWEEIDVLFRRLRRIRMLALGIEVVRRDRR